MGRWILRYLMVSIAQRVRRSKEFIPFVVILIKNRTPLSFRRRPESILPHSRRVDKWTPAFAGATEGGVLFLIKITIFGVFVIARSISDEAIYFTCGVAIDCFATLAMTNIGAISIVPTSSAPVWPGRYSLGALENR